MRSLAGIVALLVCAGDVQAQPRWTMEVTGLALREAWDHNDATESLAGVGVGVDRPVWRALAVRGELLALRVRQEPAGAWLRGLTFGARTRWSGTQVRPIVDVAVGVSDSTQPVPARGTRFNYLAVIGAGVDVPLRAARLAVTGRWVHASNNGRDGRHRNPDIQALGVTLGIAWEY